MATKMDKLHKASPAVNSTAGRAEATDSEAWNETQELLDDPVFMESHARAEKDKANGVSKKFSGIRRI
ncbi:MAG: hypothetical protein OXT74_13130 [Candidatus Poribacteria bacterium]|nr:hypothetical protein [Candidatus Poribacteria bacterium]